MVGSAPNLYPIESITLLFSGANLGKILKKATISKIETVRFLVVAFFTTTEK